MACQGRSSSCLRALHLDKPFALQISESLFFFLPFFFFSGVSPLGMGGALGVWCAHALGLACRCVMAVSGFVSVVGGRRGAGIVARVIRGGWVWARRALPSGAGWHPAPACVFVPFASRFAAVSWGRAVARSRGFSVWVRRGSEGSPVFATCGLPVPAWCVKIALPPGVRVAAVRPFVRSAA